MKKEKIEEIKKEIKENLEKEFDKYFLQRFLIATENVSDLYFFPKITRKKLKAGIENQNKELIEIINDIKVFIYQHFKKSCQEKWKKKKKIRWYKNRLKKYAIFFEHVLDGEKAERVAKELKLL